MSTQVQMTTAQEATAEDHTATELEEERRRRENTMPLAVGGPAAAGLGVALLSMLMNNQRGTVAVRM
ncbi:MULTISPECIES: hypothetical protein [unclassified Kitasatospora]|uniref:hypothetical protein n=1 Tax=unclassified Kitasatospora TaxID=2633591 RepID=UPI003815F047